MRRRETLTGAAPCAQCHAFNGASDGSRAFPRIAGQSAYYLAEQLRDFASGVRANAFMTPMAKGLTPNDISDVAAYYAAQDASFLPLRKPDAALVKTGEGIAKVGNENRRIQAAIIAMGWKAPVSLGRFLTLRGNTRPISLSNC